MAVERASVRLPLRVLADSASWTLSAWLVEPGSTVYRNQRVASLQSPSTGAVDHALAPRAGKLSRTLVAKGASVNVGAQSPADFNRAIAEIEFCPHSVVFSGLCGVCGEEVAQGHFADVQAEGAARLPVAYNASTLSVTRAEAESIASTTARQLLSQKRLSLVLDLDHTLVHATDDPRAAAVLEHSAEGTDLSSVASFSLSPVDGSAPRGSPLDNRMHLKLRPHLAEFLTRCACLFELHIYTMGSRPYADRVAELIDPDKRLFSGRITSREDFEEGRSNQKNISRLFPCDDSMVLIIDDREDVWVSGTGASFMPNLIRAKPYTFWNGMHETYDRALSSGTDASARVRSVPNRSGRARIGKGAPSGTSKPPEEPHSQAGGECTLEKADPSVPRLKNGTDGDGSSVKSVNANGLAASDAPSRAAVERPSEPMPALSEELRMLVNQWWHNDSPAGGWNTHLKRLADVLELCHSRFFEAADEGQTRGSALNGNGKEPLAVLRERTGSSFKIPADVKAILANIRSDVLKGCVVTFTGVIALGTPPEQSPIWELALRHGAECCNEFLEGETTHVVASAERGLSTEKTLSAIESCAAFVVDLTWLEDSTIHFERRPELLYTLGEPPINVTWQEHREAINVAYCKARERRQAELASRGEAGVRSPKVSSNGGNCTGLGTRKREELEAVGGVRLSKSRRVAAKHVSGGDSQQRVREPESPGNNEDDERSRVLEDEEVDDVMMGLL